MTYKGLMNLFAKVNVRCKLPEEMLHDFEILTDGYDNHVYLVGASEVGNVITISCQFARNEIIEDSAVLQSYNRLSRDWDDEYFNAGYHCGISQPALQSALMRVLNKNVL